MNIAVIPARFESSRFPGKPLVDIAGKSMIQRVYEACRSCNLLDRVIVATDDQRIFNEVESFGGEVIMTPRDVKTGTERVIIVAKKLQPDDLVINVQGDEPMLQSEHLESLIKVLKNGPFSVATLARPIKNLDSLQNPNVVKVVFNKNKSALYFSRSVIPFVRDNSVQTVHYQHIGIYGFRQKTLLELGNLPESPVAEAEKLEQLQWLEHGHPIGIGIVDLQTISIDTPEDLYRVLDIGYF